MTKSLSLICSFCHHLNHGIIARPSDKMAMFTCETCGNENYIVDTTDEIGRKSLEEPFVHGV